MFYTYIIRCKDDTLYTGYTTDIRRRVSEHKRGINCKYTRSRKFSSLEAVFISETRSCAMKLECYIKSLTRKKKLDIIENPEKLESEFFDIKKEKISHMHRTLILTIQ